MSSSILPGSPEATLLQSEIHRELIRREYADDSDTTMAEYVSVMLINQKTPEQIGAELTDLLGGDFDPSFTPWLYEKLEAIVRETAQSVPESASASAITISETETNRDGRVEEAEEDVSMRDDTRRNMSSTGRLLSSALNPLVSQSAPPAGPAARGQKRGMSPNAGHGAQHTGNDAYGANKRRSVGNVPTGPRNGSGRVEGGRREVGGIANADLLGRIGGHASQYGLNTDAREFRGAGAMNPRGGWASRGPASNLRGRQQPGSFQDPNLAMQQGQMLAAMNASMHGNGMGGGDNTAALQNVMRQQQEQLMAMQMMMHQMAQAVQGQHQPLMAAPRAAPTAQPSQKLGAHTIQARHGVPAQPNTAAILLSKPSSTVICKYGVGCTNARCVFSHPSPVATQASGLVLRTEPCPQGKNCTDADCGYSHVSPAQVHSDNPGTLRILCKFPECTNPSCQFRHEDAKGNPIPPPALTKQQTQSGPSRAVSSGAMETDEHDELDVQINAGSSNTGLAAARLNIDEALGDEPAKASFKTSSSSSSAKPLPNKPLNGTIPVACKFAAACTNKMCKFIHDSRKPCKFGVKCHRSDCTFSHPPGRHTNEAISSDGFSEFKPKTHISDRSFANMETETEKAIPGEAGVGPAAEDEKMGNVTPDIQVE